MKKILLVCGAGMSTSLLVKRIKEADIEHHYQVRSCDIVSAKIEILDNDIFLLAPHISYMKDEFQPLCEASHIPFMIIDPLDYTKMNGDAVLKKVELILLDYERENPLHVALLHSKAGAMSDLLLLDMNKKRKGEEKKWIIESMIVDRFEDDGTYHLLLLEPQICFEEKSLKKRVKSLVIIDVAPMQVYSSFNGKKMLDYIYEIYQEKIKIEKNKMKEGIEKL